MINAYIVIAEYVASFNLELELSLDLFEENFFNSDFATVDEFAISVLESLQLEESATAESVDNIDPSSGSFALQYYHNTGLGLPSRATYGRYLLLPNIRKGDIIHENAGGPNGMLGHSAIVEGKFFCTSRRIFFVRLVESITIGVVRSILDDQRIDQGIASVL